MIKFSLEEQATTPVPTIFLKKYMCDAPPDYVRVYLFGLCLAYTGEHLGDVEMEERLHMSSAQIISALEYWESKGFVKSRAAGKTTVYDFMAGPEEHAQQENSRKAPVYEYKNFNNVVSTLLGRTLSPSDLNNIYDFTDVFGLPQDVVVTMVEYCVAAKGKNVGIAYLDKVAQTWAEEGIDTREKAQQRIEDHKAVTSGAKMLMRIMGITGRNPGKKEMDFYDKWTEKWALRRSLYNTP
jgi:DnaD/phage-associated family protein